MDICNLDVGCCDCGGRKVVGVRLGAAALLVFLVACRAARQKASWSQRENNEGVRGTSSLEKTAGSGVLLALAPNSLARTPSLESNNRHFDHCYT